MSRRPSTAERWQELADLPYAGALVPSAGGLPVGGQHDTVHFDKLELDEPDAADSRFLECALTHVSVQGGRLRRAKFSECWLRDVRLTGTSLAESAWAGSVITESSLAGVEAFGSDVRGVVVRQCKLDSVNFRGATLTDVTFRDCVLRDVDFTEAALARTAFPGCKLTGVKLVKVTLDAVDLRGAELGLTIGPGSLRGAIVTTAQLIDMSMLLADALGISVQDD